MNYFRAARIRAKRRTSLWNLLLLAATLCNVALFAAVCLYAVDRLHQYAYPGESLAQSHGVTVIFSTVPILFAALPIGFLLANAQVRMVPAAFRALDDEASTVKGTDYRSSQRSLVRITLFVAPACLAIATAACLLPWRR